MKVSMRLTFLDLLTAFQIINHQSSKLSELQLKERQI